MVGFSIEEEKKIEDWMEILLAEKCFVPCINHQSLKKNESNKFCLNCRECFCQRCSSSDSHAFHKVIQIRRYMYHYVVRVKDMNQHFNCTKIQHYANNGSRVVYLNSREVVKPLKGLKPNGGSFCEHCEKSVAEPHRYCSIACKVAATTKDGRDESGCQLFPAKARDLRSLSFIENQDSESDMKQNDSSDSFRAERESSSDDHGLNNSPSLRPRHRVTKRKGFPFRAPHF